MELIFLALSLRLLLPLALAQLLLIPLYIGGGIVNNKCMTKPAILLILFILVLTFPSAARAGSVWRISLPAEETQSDTTSEPQGRWAKFQRWLQGRVKIVRPEIGAKFTVESTAYTPSPYETDSTPCITAAGTRVRPGVVASNFLPLGTLLKVVPETSPKVLTQTLFIVEDRMNPRFNQRLIDVWFPTKEAAFQFGRRPLTMEVIGYGTPGQSLTLEDSETEAIEQSLLKRANLRFVASARSLSRLLTAAVGRSEVVDCFATE